MLLSALLAAGCDSRPAVLPVAGTPAGMASGRDDLRLGSPPDHRTPDALLAALAEDRPTATGGVRSRHQRDASLRHGSQAGYRSRAWELAQMLEARSRELSAVYDFNRVARPAPAGAGYLLPPVVQGAQNAFQSDNSGRTVSVADRYFEILKPERIAPAPPTWRSYLLFKPAPANPLPAALRPASAEEREQVAAWIREGWSAGSSQAEHELALRLRRLRRDYEGMLEFRRLAARGMIDPVGVEFAEFGVTGDPGVMRTGDRTVRIVGNADFRRDPTRWRTDRPAGRHGDRLD